MIWIGYSLILIHFECVLGRFLLVELIMVKKLLELWRQSESEF
jgi:hypothetical protein